MRAQILVSTLFVAVTACSFSSGPGQIAAMVDASPEPDGATAIDAAPIDAPPAIPTVPVLRTPSRNAYLGTATLPASLRPTFTWAASTTTGGAVITYQLQLSTDATFTTGVTSASVTTTSFTPAAALAVSATAPVGARYHWRIKACVAADRCSAYSAVWWINLGRTERDFNGDGFADVVVGATGNDTGGDNAGRAYVYFGAAGGVFNTTADGILTGAAAGDQFGSAVAAAGDVNGDGFADVLVGARFNGAGGNNAGRAYLYFGAAGTTFNTTADATLTGAAANDNFGTSVAGAGDVNGDGFADLLVGSPGNSAAGTNAGATYLYLGGAGAFNTASDGTLLGAAASDNFGTSVAGAGDVNGDGFADLIVGAFRNAVGGMNAGRSYVYFGGATFDPLVDGTLTGATAGDAFGTSVSTAGDVNDDGFADVLVGAPFNDAGGADAGRAYLFFGAAGATFENKADGMVTGAAASDVLGTSVATAGDVNGDGFADLLVGAHGSDVGGVFAGRAYVYYGAATFDATADGTLTGAAAGDFFGISVAAAGDVNGDGFADLIIGAQLNDGGGADAGRAYLYFGAATFDATADGTLTGATAGDGFGSSVAAADKVQRHGTGSVRSARRASTSVRRIAAARAQRPQR